MNEKSKEQKLLELDRRIEKQKRITEKSLRKMASMEGYSLKKSDANSTNTDNLGGFMIVDAKTNAVVAGCRYELNELDVWKFVFDKMTKVKSES